jgi:hypothetical protein
MSRLDWRNLGACAIGVGMLLAADPALADPFVDAGIQGRSRVALDTAALPAGEDDGIYSAVLGVFDRDWPTSGIRYELWLAEFDCNRRTRTVTSRHSYSSTRDPVRTIVTQVSNETASGVASQLAIVCDSDRSWRSGPHYSLKTFSAGLGTRR